MFSHDDGERLKPAMGRIHSAFELEKKALHNLR